MTQGKECANCGEIHADGSRIGRDTHATMLKVLGMEDPWDEAEKDVLTAKDIDHLWVALESYLSSVGLLALENAATGDVNIDTIANLHNQAVTLMEGMALRRKLTAMRNAKAELVVRPF